MFQAGQNVKLIKEITGHVSNAVEKYEITSDQQRMDVSDIIQGQVNTDNSVKSEDVVIQESNEKGSECPMEVEVNCNNDGNDKHDIISNAIKSAVEATGNKRARFTITIDLLE